MTGAASSQSTMLTEPGPTPASSTTAFTRSRGQARRQERGAASPGMRDQDGALHAPFVQVINDHLGVGGKARGVTLARAVSGAVLGHRVQVGRQTGQDGIPVGGAAGLAVEQDEFMRVRRCFRHWLV